MEEQRKITRQERELGTHMMHLLNHTYLAGRTKMIQSIVDREMKDECDREFDECLKQIDDDPKVAIERLSYISEQIKKDSDGLQKYVPLVRNSFLFFWGLIFVIMQWNMLGDYFSYGYLDSEYWGLTIIFIVLSPCIWFAVKFITHFAEQDQKQWYKDFETRLQRYEENRLGNN